MEAKGLYTVILKVLDKGKREEKRKSEQVVQYVYVEVEHMWGEKPSQIRLKDKQLNIQY